MTKKKTEVAVVRRPPEEPKEQPYSVELFISQAIEKNLPVETMERLLAMRTQLKQEQAIEAYNDAVSEFQRQCPVIEKKKKVYQKGTTPKQIKDGTAEVRYSYAPLDSIVEQTSELMGQCGLSHRIEVLNEDKFISVTCYLIHRLGHKEGSTFRVPIDFGAYMTEQQKYAAALTYAKRYAFCAVTGILTGDEDNDANVLSTEEPPKPVSAPRPAAPVAPTPPPVVTKPVTPPAAPVNADDAKKQRITKLMRDNGLQPAVSTKESWEDAVRKNMGLELKPENYDKIISILESTMGGPPQPPVTPPPAPPTTPTAPVAGPASTAQTATPNAPLGAGGNGGIGYAPANDTIGGEGGGRDGHSTKAVPVSQAEQLKNVFGDGVMPAPADPKNYRARAMGCTDSQAARKIIEDMKIAGESAANVGMISGILEGKGFFSK